MPGHRGSIPLDPTLFAESFAYYGISTFAQTFYNNSDGPVYTENTAFPVSSVTNKQTAMQLAARRNAGVHGADMSRCTRLVQKFNHQYDGDPDLNALEGVASAHVLHIGNIFEPGAQCFQDTRRGTEEQPVSNDSAFIMMCLILDAISKVAEDPSVFTVVFESLARQEYESESRVINLETNNRAREAGHDEAPALLTKGKEEDEDNDDASQEAVIHVEIPTPVLRNLDPAELTSEGFSPAGVAAQTRPGSYTGFRMWIFDSKGGSLNTALEAAIARNATFHDRSNRSTFRLLLAGKSLLTCEPEDIGKKVLLNNVGSIISEYYRSVAWAGFSSATLSFMEALNPVNYFSRAAVLSDSRQPVTFAQTGLCNYALAPRVYSFPSGMNTYMIQGEKIDHSILKAYLPWVQTWVVAPAAREFMMEQNIDHFVMQGVEGVKPKPRFGRVGDTPVTLAESGGYYRPTTTEEIEDQRQRESVSASRSFSSVGVTVTSQLPPLKDPELAYTPLLPQPDLDYIMRRKQEQHPRKASEERWKAVKRRAKVTGTDVEELRQREVQHYLESFRTATSSQISRAETSVNNWGLTEMPNVRIKTETHPMIDPDLTLGDELSLQIFTMIACLVGNVDKTGLVMLILMMGLTTFDFVDVRPHIFMTGPPGASKSWMMRILSNISIPGVVTFIMRFTTQALSTGDPDGGNVFAVEEFQIDHLSTDPRVSGGANTNLKTRLAGGAQTTAEPRIDEKTGKRTMQFSENDTPSRFSLLAASNHPAVGTTTIDGHETIDSAIIARLLFVHVTASDGTPDRNVQQMVEYLKTQPEAHRDQVAYFTNIFRCMQWFHMHILNLIESKVFEDYDYTFALQLFREVCTRSEASNDPNAVRISTRKQKAYLAMCRGYAMFGAFAHTYLDPRSDLYGVTPSPDHLMEVYGNAGAIGPDVAIKALGSMTPAFENPIIALVAKALAEPRPGMTFYAQKKESFEEVRPTHQSKFTFAANKRGVYASASSNSTHSLGPDELSEQQGVAFVNSMDDFEERERLSNEERDSVRDQLTKAIRDNNQALGRAGISEIDKEKIRKKVMVLKTQAAALQFSNAEQVAHMSRKMGIKAQSGPGTHIRSRFDVMPGWVTYNMTLADMVKFLRGKLLSAGQRVSPIILSGLITSMMTSPRHYQFVSSVPPNHGLIGVDAMTTVSNASNGPPSQAFSVIPSGNGRPIVAFRKELYEGLSATSSFVEILRKAVKTVYHSDVPGKFLLMVENKEYPQFVQTVTTTPHGGVTTTILAAPLETGEEEILFGRSRNGANNLVPAPQLVQYEANSSFPPVQGFYSKFPRVRELDPVTRKLFLMARMPMTIKARAMGATVARTRLALTNYPVDQISAKMKARTVRAAFLRFVANGDRIRDADPALIGGKAMGKMYRKRITEDGAVEVYLAGGDGRFPALPEPPSTPTTPSSSSLTIIERSKKKLARTKSALGKLTAREAHDIVRQLKEEKNNVVTGRFTKEELERQKKRPRLLTKQSFAPRSSVGSLSIGEFREAMNRLRAPWKDPKYAKKAKEDNSFEGIVVSSKDFKPPFKGAVTVRAEATIFEGMQFCNPMAFTRYPSEKKISDAKKKASKVGRYMVSTNSMPMVRAAQTRVNTATYADVMGWIPPQAEESAMQLSYDPELDPYGGLFLNPSEGGVYAVGKLRVWRKNPSDDSQFALAEIPLVHEKDNTLYINPGVVPILAEIMRFTFKNFGDVKQPCEVFSPEVMMRVYQLQWPEKTKVTVAGSPSSNPGFSFGGAGSDLRRKREPGDKDPRSAKRAHPLRRPTINTKF
jgi:hypothetical protein